MINIFSSLIYPKGYITWHLLKLFFQQVILWFRLCFYVVADISAEM
jgi:hypothetical protein